MPNWEIDLKKIAALPTPVAAPCYHFARESHPIIKLQRLIDCFEVILKYSATIAIQSFFAEGLEKQSVKTAQLIMEKIQRPSLGNYVEMLREVCTEFGSVKENPFITCIKPLVGLQQIDRLLALRNDFKGHGATPDEKLAEKTLNNFFEDFLTVLERTASLSNLGLHIAVEQRATGETMTSRLHGYSVEMHKEVTLSVSGTQVGHLIIYNENGGRFLDLYPLLTYACDDTGRSVVLFFNNKKSNAIFFLDYELGRHHEFTNPAEVVSSFESRFPRPSSVALSGTNNQVADWFIELIGATTENFVGRANELKRLEKFAAGGVKPALIITGPPGVGKTSLLAEWTKSEMCFRHFIREGDAATYEPARVFENLGLQLAKVYALDWHRPPGDRVVDSVNEFRRLLTEAASKAASPILIMIDGLDEAQRSGLHSTPSKRQKTLIDWLPSPETLPTNTRLIFSTRPELLENAVFDSKYGSDKSEHLPLGRLTENDVRAMLFQVCNWYEVTASPGLLKVVFEKSEGSPLYIRLLVEDLATRNIKLSEISALPTGVEAYFKRILSSIDAANRISSHDELESQFRAKVEVLKDLEKQGKLSSADVNEACKRERDVLQRSIAAPHKDVLCLFALAREPLDITTASLILGDQNERVKKALCAIRTVLDERGNRFVLFHSALRSFILSQRSEAAARMKVQLVNWCMRYAEHKNGYALRNCVTHLCDEFEESTEPHYQIGVLKKLEDVLTDFTFIELNARAGFITGLLRDYREALAIWPSNQRYDPFQIPAIATSEIWMQDCVRSVLMGEQDPHPAQGAGPVLQKLRVLRDEQGLHHYGYLVNQGMRPISAHEDLPDHYFVGSPLTEATIAAMVQTTPNIPDLGVTTAESVSLKRIEQFLDFVSSHRHLLDGVVDVLALAFNHSAAGDVVTKAESLCRARTRAWIKRHNRRAAANGHPLLVRPLPAGESEFISPDFQNSVVADVDQGGQSGAWAVKFQIVDLLTGQETKAASQAGLDEAIQVNTLNRLVVSANLKMAVLGNAVWDIETAKPKVVFGDVKLRASAISGCGHMAVIAINEPNLQLWNVETGDLVRIFEEMDSEIHDLAMSCDGKIIAAASHWGHLTLWDTTDGEPLLKFNDDPHVHSVALTPDAKFVVCGGDSGSVWVLDALNGVVLRQFTDQSRDYFGVAITPDGRIVTAQDSDYLRVWDVKTGRMLRKIAISPIPHRVKLSADGALAVAGSHIIDLRQGELPITGEKSTPTSAAISPDGRMVLIADSSGNVALHDFNSPTPTRIFDRPTAALPESEDGYRIHLLPPTMNREATKALLPYTDGLLFLADLVSGRIELINSPAFVKKLVQEELPKKEADAARLRGEDRLQDELKEMRPIRINTYYGMTHAVLTPDGRFAITSRDGEAVRIWDTSTGDCVKALPIPFIQQFTEGEVCFLIAMPDSKSVVFATQDGRINIWKFLESTERFLFSRNKYSTSPRIAISSDGKKILFGGWFDPIEVWDISSDKLLNKFESNPDAITHYVGFSPDNSCAVVACGTETLDNEITVWNIESGSHIAIHALPSSPIHLSEVSKDGKFVCITDNGEVHYLSLENILKT